MTVLINVIVMTGMCVLMPLGLRLIAAPGLTAVTKLWPIPAACGALSLWLPRGGVAAGLAGVYALATIALIGCSLAHLWIVRRINPFEVAILTALVCPWFAASALVAERAGYPLFGFDLVLLALTAPHLHFAGFGAALIAGLLRHATPNRHASAFAALSVPAGTFLVLIGYFMSQWVEFAGAVVLTLGMWTVGVVTVQAMRTRSLPRATHWAFYVSSAVLTVTMVLAVWYALGEATGIRHPDLMTMVATHGMANAFGFGVCGLLAWHHYERDPARFLRPHVV